MADDRGVRLRRRIVSLYLREDIAEALARVAAETDISVSRVAEILLAFHLELNTLIEKWSFLLKLNRRFHKTA